MNDKELDQLLASATKPRISDGFNEKLLQRLNAEVTPASGNVINFPARSAPQAAIPWPRILPLVASMAAALVGGIYLGAATDVAALISDGSAIASVDDSDFTGFDDLATFEQDSQS